jgi:peroxiredoxin Q/BCP
VLGASFDPPEANKAFADAEGFGFRLLSDVDRAVGTAYGVLRPPDDQYASMPTRVSFLIDPDGVIRRTYEVKDTAAHADEVLADLATLRSS